MINVKKMLKEHQLEHFDKMMSILDRQDAALDRSTTGTGKTYVACAIAYARNLKPIVICPRAAIHTWRSVLAKFGVRWKLIGNYEAFKFNNSGWGRVDRRYYPFLLARELGIPCEFAVSVYSTTPKECMDMLRVSQGFISQWEAKNQCKLNPNKWMRVREFVWNQGIINSDCMFIFDEAHYCKAEHSINARMLAGARTGNNKVLALSATPGYDPRHMRSLGYLLGMFPMEEYKDWLQAHGVVQGSENRLVFLNKVENMKRLNSEMEVHGGRMDSKDIPGFPKTVITAQAYTVENPELFNRKFYQMLESYEKCVNRGDRAEALTLRLRYRMWAEYSKTALFAELASNELDKGNSVVIFMNFDASRKKLAQLLKTRCMVFGEQSDDERNDAVAAFFNDRERIIICNIQAGGVALSLHDTKGRYPRVALISPTYDPILLKQALGRVHRDEGRTVSFQRIVYLAGTVEQEVCSKVNTKLDCMSALNEGDLMENDYLKLKSVSQKPKEVFKNTD